MYNRFRSRVAEAYFKKINKNKKIKVKGAGAIKGSPLSKMQISSAKEFGINIKGKRQGLSTKLFKWFDVVIIVADDVPLELFNSNKKFNKKTIVWKIKDTKIKDENENKRIIKLIMKKVDRLNKTLEKK